MTSTATPHPNPAADVRLALLLDAAAEFADLTASFAISAREAASRGWVQGARWHSMQVRECAIELLKTTREATEMLGGRNG
jgi:hypothetical protein